MLFKLEPCPDSFSGDLGETPPQHLLFWAEFPALASALSPTAKDLFNRVLVREPLKRITLSQMLKHPWFQEGSETELTPDYFQREMMPRQPNKAQV
jgi:serine/threonine protein kinase